MISKGVTAFRAMLKAKYMMNVRTLAEAAGLNPDTILDAVRGKRSMQISTMGKLLSVITAEDLDAIRRGVYADD